MGTGTGIILALGIFLFAEQVASERRCKYFGGQNLAPGRDISFSGGIAWSEDCCKLCLHNPACQGFTHNGNNNCWLKYVDAPLIGEGGGFGVTSGVIVNVDTALEARQEKTCESYGVNQNLDPGHDLLKISAVFSYDECCARCKEHSACTGFVHNNLNDCWMKYATGPWVPDDPKWNTHGAIIKVSDYHAPKPFEPEWPEGGVPAATLAACKALCQAKVGAGCREATYYPTQKACVLKNARHEIM